MKFRQKEERKKEMEGKEGQKERKEEQEKHCKLLFTMKSFGIFSYKIKSKLFCITFKVFQIASFELTI